MKKNILHILAAAAMLALALAAAPAFGAEAQFERNFKVKGQVQLSVGTSGEGTIHLTVGRSDRVHVVGHVRSNWGGNVDDRVAKYADSPPVEQVENIIRVGSPNDSTRHMTVDYEVEAPADAFVYAIASAGNVVDEGVGMNVKLATGSGDIHATGLKGALEATSNTGDIEIGGTPTKDWHITTDGNVEFWVANAGVALEARADAGRIDFDRPQPAEVVADKHHVATKLNGGGPEVKIESATGMIRIH